MGKQLNLVWIVGLAGLVIAWKLVTRGNTSSKPNSFTPADFSKVPEMGSPENTPITEAAYHQGASDFAPAAGANENQPDEEVLNLQ